MFAKRIKETLGLLMIGDGALCLAYPEKHVSLWTGGPAICRKAMQSFADHPKLTRSLGAISLGLGLWMAKRQYRFSKSAVGSKAKTAKRELVNV